MPRPLTKGELGFVETPRTIQSTRMRDSGPEINFSWSPQLIAYTLQVGGNIYPYGLNEPAIGAPAQPDIHRTAALQELTFVASVRVPDGIFITEYEWDFGDGVKGFGETVTHTYTTPSPSTRTRLCVTDNRGRRYCLGKPMNLYAADLTVVGGFSLVNPPIILNGNTTATSASITNLSSTADLAVGMGVAGDGIPMGATVTGIGPTSITISAPATITATNVELIFSTAP